MNKTSTPLVIWITGLPGAGKTTLATGILEYLKSKSGEIFFHLDGDVIRREIFSEIGFSKEDRYKISCHYQNIVKILTEQNINVIVSTVSMFEDIYSTNRELFSNYVEVFLNPSLPFLQNGPRKHIYDQKNELNPINDYFHPKFSEITLTASTNKDREFWLETTLNYLQNRMKL